MTSDCTPPAGTPEEKWPCLDNERSAHWLDRFGEWSVMMWDGQFWPTSSGAMTSREMAEAGWRYHSAVPEPDEVEALRKVVLALLNAGGNAALCEMINTGLAAEEGWPIGSAYLTPLGHRALGVEG